MASKEPYIIIPRSIFTGEAWKRASLEQKGAMFELIIHAAYEGFEYDSHLGNVYIEKNQILTSFSKLAECWRITKGKVRSIINYWKTSKLIETTVVSMSQAAQQNAQFLARCTLLTVNGLYDSSAQCSAQQTAQEKLKKKKLKKKNTPIPPTGADSSSDFSPDFPSEEVERCMQEVEEMRMKLSAAWQKIFDDGIWTVDLRMFTPLQRYGFIFRESQVDEYRRETRIPLLRTTSTQQAFYFIEFHLTDAICYLTNYGKHLLFGAGDVKTLTNQLLSQSADLTLAQVALFFYFLSSSNPTVCPPEWNGTLTTDLITTAFSKYLEWLKG